MKIRKLFIFILVIFFTLLYVITSAKEKIRVIKESDGLPHRFIKCITSDGNFIWIGTANGLALYDTIKEKVTKRWTIKEGLIDNFITGIGVDGDYVWVATSGGISVYNKKIDKFEKKWSKANGLSDNFITGIVVSENYVWASTKFWGIDRYDKKTGVWRNFSVIHGLADNSVNCIKPDGVLIWAGTKKGLSYYDEFSGLWITYDQTQGLVDQNITSIEVDGGVIWCGTGSGLAKFDKYSEKFRIFTTADGLVDDFVQSLKLDGNYLWIGTFSGVSKYDKSKNKWTTYTVNEGLSENSVSAIEIDGNYVWFGTDGGGITIFDKELPQAMLSSLSFYKEPGKIILIGSAYDYNGIDSFKLSFKREGMKEWVSTGIKVLESKNIKDGKIAEWDVRNLPNFEHTVKLEVINKKGLKNEHTLSFLIDTKEPALTLNELPDAVKEKTIYLSGTFLEDNLTRIIIQPENIQANLNRMTRKYTAEVPLKQGINNLRIVAYDIANQSNYIERKVIYDTDIPEIVLEQYPTKVSSPEIELKGIVKEHSLQKIVLNPGNIMVPFNLKNFGEYQFSVPVKLESGPNSLQIVAYDYVGNKSSKDIKINYESTFPVVKIDKSVTKVNKPDFELKGEWSDDNIDYIFIEPVGKNANIDLKNKTFSLKLKLKEGENLITATIVDKDGNKSIDIHSIIYTTAKSFIEITYLPEWTFEKNPTVRGKFSEPNLSKIILLPNEKEAMIDYKNNTFSIQIPDLKYGENKFEIALIDKFNNKTTKQFSIFYDDKKPVINLSELPKVVNVNKISIYGNYEDDYIDKIILKPFDIQLKIDSKNKKFEGSVNLNAGENKIRLVAYDKAGNITEVEKVINYVPQVTTAVEETVDSEYVKRLKAEIESLKAQLAKRSLYKEEEVRIFVPQGSAFYFVPYIPSKGLNLINISEKYLGSPLYIDFLNRINSSENIEKLKKVLLPTKELLKIYKTINDKKLENILDIIGLSYYNSNGNLKILKRNLIRILIKRELLPFNSVEFYEKSNIINLGDYLIALNTKVSALNKNLIQLTPANSFLKVNLILNKAYSRE